MLILLAATTALANEEGIVGLATHGCADCHGEAADPAVTVSLGAATTTVAGGETLALTLTVASSNSDHLAAGLDIAASDGLLIAAPTMIWREHELTHQFPHDMVDGATVFEFGWTAPAYATTVTLSAAGNAVNWDGVEQGDGWNLDSLELAVESDCSDADGDHVGDCEGDCDDGDPAVYPGAEDTWYDGVDSDCGGDDDFDADGDGVPLDSDCDDTDPDRSAAQDCAEDSGSPPDADSGSSQDGGARSEPEPDSKGCSVLPLHPAPLLLLPLLALRRRRSRVA